MPFGYDTWKKFSTIYKMKCRLYFLLLFLLTIGINGFCQNKNNFKLTGTRNYVYNYKGEQTEKQSYDAANNLIRFVHYIYDENGNKIETIKYDKDSMILVRYIYVYSAENERTHCIKIDYKKNTEEKRTYKHNAQGKVITTAYYQDSVLKKNVVTEYSPEGNCIAKKRYNAQDMLLSESHYQYKYKNGKIAEKKRLGKDGTVLVKTTYSYNNDGTENAYVRKYTSGKKPVVKRKYHYNKNGQCTGNSIYELVKEKTKDY